jgi:hypothetical protein
MKKPVIEIIAVTYGHGFQLKCFIDSIRSQTDTRWCLHIIHDGPGKAFDNLKEDLSSNGYLDDDRIVLTATKTRSKEWGHPLREYGLRNRISEAPYITITNCDNYYLPVWVSEITRFQNKDFIYWDCVHSHKSKAPCFDRPCGSALLNSKLQRGGIDMGCVAVNSNIATKVGFPFRAHQADWQFFESCLKDIQPDKVEKISKILFVHN